MTDLVVTVLGETGSGDLEASAWDGYIASHPNASIYHTRAWRTVQEKSFGYRSWLLMAKDRSGGVVGVLPLYRVANPFSSRIVSVPFRDRGGPLWNNDAAFDALMAHTRQIVDETHAGSVQLKSLQLWSDRHVRTHALTQTLHWIHSNIPLDGVTTEALWQRLGSKTRNMVRQAEGHGLDFHDVTGTQRGLDDWYALHLLTQKRLGVPPFPRRFFETMAAELCRIGAFRLYCVRQGEKALAATLVLTHRNTAIYGYSASSRDAQQLRANDLMLYRVMRLQIESGLAQFDMGSDAPAQESLLFFKRKWGAQQQQIPTYSFGTGRQAITDSSSQRYALARKVFTHLPTPLSSLAGRLAVKYFG